MEESLTQGTQPTSSLPTEQPTAPVVETPTAESQSQETISSANPQEAVSTTPAEVTNPSGDVETDDGLAKFAKGQGISDEDYEQLSDREKKLLKIAHDNQKAFRAEPKPATLSDDGTQVVDPANPDGKEDEEFKREFRQYKYEKQTDEFFSKDGRDRSLEPVMVEVLNDTITELTPVLGEDEAKRYAFALSRDFDTLYVRAQLKSGKFDPTAAKEEGRREERDSIRRQASAGAPEAHAVLPGTKTPTKVDRDWLQNTYDPKNPEHQVLLADAMARGDLY